MPSIDLAIAAPIAVALIGGLGVLWRHTTTQIDALRGQLADAIDRIRELEAARLSDRDQHAHQIMALTERSIRNEERTRQVLQTLLRVLRSRRCLLDRQCNGEPHPSNLPECDTEVLERRVDDQHD